MKSLVKTLGAITTAGMFVVLIMGAAVTNTGSEQGCGHSWPLCRGKLIPQFAVSTFIEFSHRAVVGIETVLILSLAAGAWYLYRRRREIQILVPLMVLFLFLQAGLGAWAVMYPQFAPVLALHFGVSLIAFASVLLTTLFLFSIDGSDTLRDRDVPRRFRRMSWSVTIFSYLVVYLGAFVRHTNADDACKGWPLCNGSVFPHLTGEKIVSVFVHRLAAGLLVLAILALVVWARKLRMARPDLYRASLFALAAVILQAISGAIVVFTDLDLFSALAHAALAGLTFGSLSYLCIQTLPRRLVLREETALAVSSVVQPSVTR